MHSQAGRLSVDFADSSEAQALLVQIGAALATGAEHKARALPAGPWTPQRAAPARAPSPACPPSPNFGALAAPRHRPRRAPPLYPQVVQLRPHLLLLDEAFYASALRPLLARWALLWLRGQQIRGLTDEQVRAAAKQPSA